MQRKVDVHRSSFIVHRSLPLGPASCVLRPASCVFAGPRSEVRGSKFEVRSPMSYVLAIACSVYSWPPSHHQDAIVRVRRSAALRTADFSRHGGSGWSGMAVHTFPDFVFPLCFYTFFTPVLFTAVRHPLFEPTKVSGTEIGFIAEACACCWVRCGMWAAPFPRASPGCCRPRQR